MMEPTVRGRHPDVHTTPELYGTRCDNCPRLSCYRRMGARLHPWRYYCAALCKELQLGDIYWIGIEDCPERRKLPQRRFR